MLFKLKKLHPCKRLSKYSVGQLTGYELYGPNFIFYNELQVFIPIK